MRSILTAALIVGFLVAADKPVTEAAKQDLKRIEGTWTLVSAQRDGQATPPDEVKKTKISFQGDRFEFPDAAGIGTSQKGTLQLDPSQKPKWMDSTATIVEGQGSVSLGIYEISGDDYKVCFSPPGKPRPKEFLSAPGSGVILQIWKRAKKS
ncbi:MAG: TIGR03067 domain-containing protein [Planctomycetota bacterium]